MDWQAGKERSKISLWEVKTERQSPCGTIRRKNARRLSILGSTGILLEEINGGALLPIPSFAFAAVAAHGGEKISRPKPATSMAPFLEKIALLNDGMFSVSPRLRLNGAMAWPNGCGQITGGTFHWWKCLLGVLDAGLTIVYIQNIQNN